jgi:hypothetical protein
MGGSGYDPLPLFRVPESQLSEKVRSESFKKWLAARYTKED